MLHSYPVTETWFHITNFVSMTHTYRSKISNPRNSQTVPPFFLRGIPPLIRWSTVSTRITPNVLWRIVRNHLGHHRLTISLNFCFYFAFNCRSPRFACHRAQFPKKKKNRKKIKEIKRKNRWAKMGNSQFGFVCASFCIFSFPLQSVWVANRLQCAAYQNFVFIIKFCIFCKLS